MKLMMKTALSVISVALNVLCVIAIVNWINVFDDLKDEMSKVAAFKSSHVTGDMKMVALGNSYGLIATTNDPCFFLSGGSGKQRLIVACCSSRMTVNSKCATALEYYMRYDECLVKWRWAKGKGCCDFTVYDKDGNVWMDKNGDLMWVLPKGARNVDEGVDVLDGSMVCEECPSLP